MNEADILQRLHEAIRAVKSSVESVEKWGNLLADKMNVEIDTVGIKLKSEDLNTEEIEDEKFVEGIFDGIHMISADKEEYPVPANYASKSKLVEGDKLKLTIKPNGNFVYKQIGQVARKLTKGTLILEGNQYKVLAENGRTYDILYASVTFFRAEVGDDLAIIIPEDGDARWAAVENRIPGKGEKE